MALTIKAFIVFFISSLLLIGCQETLENNRIRFALSTSVSNLDPRFATDATSERINHLLYSYLINFDDQLLPVPSLASWKKIDELTYHFYLLPNNPKFTNGQKITAHDVVASYRYVLDKKNLSPHRLSIALIEQVKVLDEQTIEFVLTHADPLFPAYLKIAILPASLIDKHNFNLLPIGSGPFSFIEKISSNNLLLQRRSDKQLIEFLKVKDPTVRVMKLLNNEIDLLQNDLSPEIMQYLQKQKQVQSIHKKGSNFSYIGFNLSDPVTGNLHIRQAISLAIDRDRIIHYVFNDKAYRAESILPPDHWAGVDDLTSTKLNLSEAKALLLLENIDSEHRLEIIYKTSSDPFRIKLATIIQSQLSKIGIDLIIKSYDWGTFFGDIKAGRFQMYSLAWVGINTPDIFRYVFHSHSIPPDGANRGRYQSNSVDEWLNQLADSENLAVQKKLYGLVQHEVHKDLPYIPLWYESQQAFLSSRIRHYSLSSNGDYDALKDIQLAQSY